MNFDRIKITSNPKISTDAIEKKIALVEDGRKLYAERTDEQALDRIAELLPTALSGMQQFCDEMNISVNVKNELADIPLFSVDTTPTGSSIAAYYRHRPNLVNFIPSSVKSESDEQLLAITIHELWHALAGHKEHFRLDKEGREETMSAVGFSRDEQVVIDPEAGLMQTSSHLDGLNEGVNELLTIETMKAVDPERKMQFRSPYFLQAQIVETLLNTISIQEQEPYGREFIMHYFNNDLFFLKKVKKHFGSIGVRIIKMINVHIDGQAVEDIHHRIIEFFQAGLSDEHRQEIFEDVKSSYMTEIDRLNAKSDGDITYVAP